MSNKVAEATIKYVRISPKKVAPVMDLVRSVSLEKAKVALAFDRSKAAKLVLKALNSAEANAVNNAKVAKDALFINEIFVGQGKVSKSGQFVGRGRFNPILKRTSHLYVSLGERAHVAKAKSSEGSKK